MEMNRYLQSIAALSALIIGFMIVAQTPSTPPPSPTPAPTKTPVTSTVQDETVTPETTPRVSAALSVRTQADLNIVTGNIQRPNGVAWIDEKLYVSCTGDWTLYEIDPATSTTRQYLYGVRNAHSIYAEVVNEQVELWIPDFQNNSFAHIFQGRTETIGSNLQGPWGISKFTDDSFLITNLAGNNVVSISKTGIITEVLTGLRSPTGITTDKDNVYVANTGSTRRSIEWFKIADLAEQDEPLDTDSEMMTPLISGLQNTTNLALGTDGRLYFSYALGTRGVVGRVDPQVCLSNGGCTNNEVEIVVYTELAAPLAGLTLTPNMRLYIHSIYSPDIYWVDLEADNPTDE